MQGIIPARLIHAGEADTFFVWLRTLHLDSEDKRRILTHWADALGIKLTPAMFARAGIERR